MKLAAVIVLLVAGSARGTEYLVCIKDDTGKVSCVDLQAFLAARDAAKAERERLDKELQERIDRAAHKEYEL